MVRVEYFLFPANCSLTLERPEDEHKYVFVFV